VQSEPRTESLLIPSEPDKLAALVTSLVARIDRLESEVKELRAENTTLRAENAELRQTVEGLRHDNARLRRENAWLKKQLFGPKRERVDPGRLHVAWAKFQAEQGVAGVESIPPAGTVATPSTAMQLLLGLTAPESASPAKEGVASESAPNADAAPPPPPPARTPRPHHAHGRSTLPEHLPVERVVLEPTVIPAGARRMGEEISERVGYRKASYVRVLVIRPKYAVDEADGTTGFAMADTPDEMIPRGLCDPAMLAHLIMGKWGDHLPWNRLEGICARQGLPLSANTMAGAAKRAEPLAKRVVDAMWAEARAEAKVLGVDASTAKVQAKGKCRKGYPWVVVADRDHVLFNFSARHSSDVPRELLRGFRGFVLADASSVYDRLFAAEDAPIEAGCWAHARRGFFYAAPADERALVGLGLADQLFRLERDFKDLSPSERRTRRLEHSTIVLDDFAGWRTRTLADPSVDPRGPLRRALQYTANHWAALRRFLDDGHVPISNNFTELQIRHIALGRNNWLFFGSEPDALIACTWLSLIASAKLHGLDPEQYLRDLFRVLPGWPSSRVLELAPKYWSRTRSRIDAAELARPLGPIAIPAAGVTDQAAE
jgi:transposase/FtsZ-binding cell division protein ZapB